MSIEEVEIDFKLIGERIKEARKKKGWSQEKMSEEIEVSVVYLSRIERGYSRISLRRLVHISKVLDITIETLISGVETTSENYLDKELYNVLIKCTPEKQKLIYNLAKIVSGVKFI